MSKPNSFRRAVAAFLAVSMFTGLQLPAIAVDFNGSRSLSFRESSLRPNPRPSANADQQDFEAPADNEVVRVSIVLEKDSTMDAGYDISTIADDPDAISYRSDLEEQQENITAAIEDEVLDGEDLDVVWNLTLAANIISANVEYGQIEDIKAIDGVKDVVLEAQYLPATVGVDEYDPNMSTSSSMIGSNAAYTAGYTGKGSLVAIIDTGIDIDHQSFDAGAFDYSIKGYTGKLMTKTDISNVLEDLNIYKNGNADVNKLYQNSKVPFAYNYVDSNYDITHDNDSQGEHGSHVTGIAAANAYIPSGGSYVSALDAVLTQGVAPDAQIITMKVFGNGGGAYDSDYMAAIEDAILLGADAINLSLGSSVPGAATSAEYQDIMNDLVNNKSGAVVTMSAGNAGYWAEETGYRYPYYDDINFDTVGSPSSYTNSLSVASVDNVGFTGEFLQVGDELIFYTETSGNYGIPLFNTLAGKSLEYVVIQGIGAVPVYGPDNKPLTDTDGNTIIDYSQFDEIKDIVKGKVALCDRGDSSFFQKADAALAAGAVAVIVINNQPGVINMQLDDFKGDIPVVSVTLADGIIFWENADENETESGLVYAVGSLKVGGKTGSTVYDNGYYTMSSFSSWGVPGSLRMKPEITAPGGNIYSVNGLPADGTAYENMSGTSMAAPQVAGMAAVIAQYVEEKGLAAKTHLNQRTLIQSLLMSTAEPIIEYYGGDTNSDGAEEGYYSILNQGAGLANVGNAINAESYILMDADAVLDPTSAADGKVKVELGDDPGYEGKYSYSFTIYNLTDKQLTYKLRTDMFTQDIFSTTANAFLDAWTVSVEADVTYDTGDTVTVAPNGSTKVKVDIEITDRYLTNPNYYVNGGYIEGFTFITPANTADGAVGVEHSIPILGYYGNWTDPAMYDNDSGYIEDKYYVSDLPYFFINGGSYTAPYSGMTYEDHNNEEEYWLMLNPYGYHLEVEGAESFDDIVESYFRAYSRAAINSGDLFTSFRYTQIRNGYVGAFATINGENYLIAPATLNYGAFYNDSKGTHQNISSKLSLGVTAEDLAADVRETLTEDVSDISITLVFIPEYYDDLVDEFGVFDPEEVMATLGYGAFLSTPTMLIDNTAPDLEEVTADADGNLTIKVSDNQYVGYVAVLSRSGAIRYAEVLPEQTDANESLNVQFNVEDYPNLAFAGEKVMVLVADYAGNVSTYVVDDYNDLDIDYSGEMFGYSDDVWYNIDPAAVSVDYGTGILPYDADLNHTINAAAYVDGFVFHAAERGLYVSPISDIGYDQAKVANLGFVAVDMAFNYADGLLYAVDDANYVWSINPLNGESEKLYEIVGFEPNANADFNKDGRTNTQDADDILAYLSGEKTAADFAKGVDVNAGDYDGDGELTTRDAHLLLSVLNDTSYVIQGLTIDADGTFYASGYNSISDYLIPEMNIFVWTEDDVKDGELYRTPDQCINIGYAGGDENIDAAGVLAYDYDNDLLYMAGDASPWWLSLYEEVLGIPAAWLDFLYVIDVESGEWYYTNEYADLEGKFSSLFVVPSEEDSVIGDSANITGITLTPSTATLMVGGSVTAEAILSPWNAPTENATINWSSNNASVAAVDANGKITAVAPGNAKITAAVSGTAVSADVTVTVVEVPSAPLRGLVGWDWSGFDISDAESYVSIAESDYNYQAGFLSILTGNIFTSDLDYDICVIDTETYEALGIANSGFAFSDAASAYCGANFIYEQLEDEVMVAVYGTEVYIVGIYSLYGFALDMEEDFNIPAPIAAIDFAGAIPSLGIDIYYTILENGDLYQLVFQYAGDNLYYDCMYVGSTGIKLSGVSAFNGSANASLLYDWYYEDDNYTDRLYLAYNTRRTSGSQLAIIDVTLNDDGETYTVNVPTAEISFGGVSPVVALHDGRDFGDGTDSFVFTGSVNTDNLIGGITAAQVETNVKKDADVLYSINANSRFEIPDVAEILAEDEEVSDNYEAGVEGDAGKLFISDVVADTEKNEIYIVISAMNATNALYDVEFDSDLLTLEDVDILSEHASYNAIAGKIHLDFADALAVEDDLVILTFSYDDKDEANLKTDIVLTALEQNTELDHEANAEKYSETATIEIVSVDIEVELDGEGGSCDAPESAVVGEDLVITLIPDEGHDLPETVTVAIDGEELDPSLYDYDSTTGELTIYGEAITADIKVITVTADFPVSKKDIQPDFDVSIDLGGNGSSNAPSTIAPGKDLEFTITPDEGYGLPETITVKIGGEVLDPSKYTYDPVTGKVVIPAQYITGKVEVIVDFVPLGDGDDNPATALPMIAVLPAIVSGAVLVLTKKRRR